MSEWCLHDTTIFISPCASHFLRRALRLPSRSRMMPTAPCAHWLATLPGDMFRSLRTTITILSFAPGRGSAPFPPAFPPAGFRASSARPSSRGKPLRMVPRAANPIAKPAATRDQGPNALASDAKEEGGRARSLGGGRKPPRGARGALWFAKSSAWRA
eukprot:CAMPEP_0182857620 /NCGR_PEP_ID=MMETSP0034_2-20130328/3158_1 /TAXON_ID=156128 /ORGANISM="Nephroselmis pyriformis, Strain CCMP717" /LENGTH=157 /DNA_ID=CAMNT_0024988875 /DNA_START=212 /DNA_END=682 /DNA_ORIENTATION=-